MIVWEWYGSRRRESRDTVRESECVTNGHVG